VATLNIHVPYIRGVMIHSSKGVLGTTLLGILFKNT